MIYRKIILWLFSKVKNTKLTCKICLGDGCNFCKDIPQKSIKEFLHRIKRREYKDDVIFIGMDEFISILDEETPTGKNKNEDINKSS